MAAEDKKVTHQVTSTRQSKANILNSSKVTDNVKVVETFDDKRKKKMRTVVLVHTEVDCSEKEMEGQSGHSKMMRTENGVVKRCNCDLDINELLRRLGDLVQEKK